MGLFTSKILTGVLAGSFTLAGAGLVFTGHDTLNNIKDFASDASNRLVQYEGNENTLVSKFNDLKVNANNQIASANSVIADRNGSIADLQSKKADLEAQVAQLGANIADLQTQLSTTNGDLDKTRADLQAEVTAYNGKVAELTKANATIKQYQDAANYAWQKAQEADKVVTQEEGEVVKANTEVSETGTAVEAAKDAAKDAQPLPSDEVKALDTTVTDISK